MPLYTPKAFDPDDFAAACRLIEDYPFATLVTAVDGQYAAISHLPMLIEDGMLTGHLARPNPHWQQFAHGRTTAIFHGPHAYISPTSYIEPAAAVPTWNYATVHVDGQPQLLEDEAAGPLLDRRPARVETGSFRTTPSVLAAKLGGIVAFRMPMHQVRAKFKMSQNRSAADREGVVAGLEGTGRHDELAVADWMRNR